MLKFLSSRYQTIAGKPVFDEAPESEIPAEIGQRAVKGVFWSYASFFSGKLLVFFSTVILARLLSPHEFGQMAFALLVLNYVNTFGDLGFSSALIYERKHPREAANVSFLFSVSAAVLWYALTILFKKPIAGFFHDPAVASILEVTAWVFIIGALGSTHDALLCRELAFQKRILPDLSRAFFKGICSVGLALAGWGVWSLVWGHFIGEFSATVALWIVVRWRPALRFSADLAKKMLRYGIQIVSVNILSTVIHHIDMVIVGSLLGSAALGLYSIAYRLPELLVTVVVWVIGEVTFPAYSKIQNDRPALQKAFLATIRYLSFFTIPFGVALSLLASSLIPLFYGPKWLASIAVMQALALAAMIRSLGSHAGDVYKATGRPDILTKVGIVRAVLMIPPMIWATRYGIQGVAIAVLIMTSVNTIINLCVASWIIDLPMLAMWTEFKAPTAGALVMALGYYLSKPLLSHLPNPVIVTIQLISGLLLFIGTIWVLRREVFEEIRTIFQWLTDRKS